MDGSGRPWTAAPVWVMAVSRILSLARFREPRDDHLSCPGLAAGTAREGCDYYPEGPAFAGPGRQPVLLFCLAPHGVYRAPSLTLGAVGFYPAISPLPRWGGIFSVTLSVAAGLRPPRPCFHRACCLVVSGLSSSHGPCGSRKRPSAIGATVAHSSRAASHFGIP